VTVGDLDTPDDSDNVGLEDAESCCSAEFDGDAVCEMETFELFDSLAVLDSLVE